MGDELGIGHDPVYPRSRGEHSKYNPLNYRIIYCISNSTDFFGVTRKTNILIIIKNKNTPKVKTDFTG